MRTKSLIIFPLILLLTACAGIADLRPGESGIADVQRALGDPQMRWQDDGGTIHLAYPRGPEGLKTFIARIGPDGRLQSIENVLDEQHFAAIKPGMGKEQVLRLLGPPQPRRTMYFEARDELAWEWRYCDRAMARRDSASCSTQARKRSARHSACWTPAKADGAGAGTDPRIGPAPFKSPGLLRLI